MKNEKSEKMLNRRNFIKISGAVTLTGLLSHFDFLAYAEKKLTKPLLIPATEKSFPYLSVSGSYYDVGFQIGKEFGDFIRLGLKRREDWFKELKDYASREGKNNVSSMLSMAEKYAPEVVSELKGWAEGSKIPFEDLFILNCKSEIEAFIEEKCGCSGCSTVVFNDGKRLIVAHNEDGDSAYDDLMFILSVKPESKVSFVALTYPGIVSGNAPAINSNGIVLTTNYIGTKEVKAGIPRYFLDRKILEAKTLDEAIKIAQHTSCAYAYHHIIASLPERRAFAIEVSPSKSELHEIKGLYLHTNHLILDTMKEIPQFTKYIKLSSIPRLKSLKKDLLSTEKSKISVDQIMTALSSHSNKPYSVCRHPEGEIKGSTLACGVFISEENMKTKPEMRLYKNNPCKNKYENYITEE